MPAIGVNLPSARQLAISAATIKNHTRIILQKCSKPPRPSRGRLPGRTPPDVSPLCNLLLLRSLVRVMPVEELACYILWPGSVRPR
jgi:hypothetical protein